MCCQHHMMQCKGPFDFEKCMAVADPDKYAELQRLREQEGKIAKELMEKAKADREAFKKLVEDYKANPSDDLKAKIREKVANCFDARVKASEGKIACMTQKLADVKKDKDATVDKIVEKVITSKGPACGPFPMMRGPGPMGCCPMMRGPGPEGKPMPPKDDKN